MQSFIAGLVRAFEIIRQILLTVAVVATIAGVVLAIALPLTLFRAHPRVAGSFDVAGVSAPVEVIRDRWGVPHIYAETAPDLFFAQGYVHAQDRFWQMEFSRRVGAGRMAELFGDDLLDTDKFLRTLGFTHIAAQELEAMDAATRGWLEAYAAGVNAYIGDRAPGALALELTLLDLDGVDIEIEDWTPVHSLTWAKVMAQDLGIHFGIERLNLALMRTAGDTLRQGYFAPYREGFPVIIDDDELLAAGYSLRAEPAGALRPSGDDVASGSNSFAVSGTRTASGAPLLASDPHLGISMPSVWYEVGLYCVDAARTPGRSAGCPFMVRGVSFAGAPGVVIGHNDRIAWALADIGDDVQDLYVEQMNPANPEQYLANGEWRDLEVRYEEIEVEGEDDPYVLRVRSTGNGPLVTDHGFRFGRSFAVDPQARFPDGLTFTALSMRWTALAPGGTLAGILGINAASNFAQFRDALRLLDVPAQTALYADVDGNIGLQTPGRFPTRPRERGLSPVPGWRADDRWTGFVPFEQLPSVLNPAKGYIVAANNPITSTRFPHQLASNFNYGFRAKRIEELLLAAGDQLTVDQAAAVQGDVYHRTAMEIIPLLDGLELAEPADEKDDPPQDETDEQRVEREQQEADELTAMDEARGRLLGWDGMLSEDSSAAALFGYFWWKLVEETFEDQWPEDRWPPSQTRLENAFFYLVQEPDALWWDDITTPERVEARDDILARALRKGYRRARKKLGKNLDEWRWGELHTAEFRNPSLGESGIAPIEALFNRGPVEVRGGNTQVTSNAWSLRKPFEVVHIASMRMVVDLGDFSASRIVHSTGQSGHPGHHHYADQIEPWRRFEYHPMLFARDDVLRHRRARMWLRPLRPEAVAGE